MTGDRTPKRPAVAAATIAACGACAVACARFGYLVDANAGLGLTASIAAAAEAWVPRSPADIADIEPTRTAVALGLVGACAPLAAASRSLAGRIGRRSGAEHGSSRWMTRSEMRRFADTRDPANNIILSRHARLRLDAGRFDLEHDRNKNVLVIGGPGSGKTRYVIKPCLLQMNASFVVTDPKGTLVSDSAGFLAASGYDVRVMDTVDFSRSMHFNPFRYLESDEDVQPLVDCILENTKPDGGSKEDPFWESMSRMLMSAMAGYMVEALPPGRRTMRTLMTLVSMVEAREDDEEYRSAADLVMEAWETGREPELDGLDGRRAEAVRSVAPAGGWGEPHASSFACKNYSQFRAAAGKTMKSVIATVNSSLWMFGLESLLELTDRDELDLGSIGGYADADLERRAALDPGVLDPGSGPVRGRTERHPGGQRKTALFLVIDDALPTFRFLAATALYLAVTRLKRYADHCPGGSLPVPVMFYLDEVANIGRIPNFESIITTVRSRNMACVPVVQGGSQLEKAYGREGARTIRTGCDTVVYLGGSDPETCREISDSMGDETIESDSRSKTYAASSSSSVSTQRTGRRLMDPAEVRKMPRGRCLVLINGAEPFYDLKYDLKSHANYPLMARCAGFDAAAARAGRRRAELGLEGARTVPEEVEGRMAAAMACPSGAPPGTFEDAVSFLEAAAGGWAG